MGGDCRANIINRFDELVIAEFAAMGTPLVGQTLAESRLREHSDSASWGSGSGDGSRFRAPTAASAAPAPSCWPAPKAGLAAFDASSRALRELTQDRSDRRQRPGGRHDRPRGSRRAALGSSAATGGGPGHHVIGDAADIRTLQRAWIDKTPRRPHHHPRQDAVNVYLTKYLRSLRPDMQILSRANLNRNVSTLHRAGADFVMSYAALGADASSSASCATRTPGCWPKD